MAVQSCVYTGFGQLGCKACTVRGSIIDPTLLTLPEGDWVFGAMRHLSVTMLRPFSLDASTTGKIVVRDTMSTANRICFHQDIVGSYFLSSRTFREFW